MSTIRSITFLCDNELYCSSEQTSDHGLPNGWFALTYASDDGKQKHVHFCSIRCLLSAASWAWGAKQIVDVVESVPADFWNKIPEWQEAGE